MNDDKPTQARARAAAADVPDPEFPVLTLGDLGVLRNVRIDDAGRVAVSLTPTYSGCPALHVMQADVVDALRRAGWREVDVRITLTPAWSSDDITATGRAKLAAAGIVPPGRRVRTPGVASPVLLPLEPPTPRCPRCDSADTQLLSAFSATACRALHRCRTCLEPFERVKDRR